MIAVVYVNGTHRRRATHAVIPVFDHGFLYGEGVYETLRTYDGAAVPVRPAHCAGCGSRPS